MGDKKIYSDTSISITPEIIAVGGKSYFVSTASSVSVVHVPQKISGLSIFLFIIAAIVFFGSVSEGGGIGILIAVILVVAGVAMIQKEKFVLCLAMASGETNVLSSSNKKYMMELKSHVEAAFRENAKARSAELVVSLPSADDSNHKTCPTCAESIKAAAIKCRFCGHEFHAAIEG